MHYRLALPQTAAPLAEKVKEEMSIIRVGTTGTYSGKDFEVIGRLQYFFQDSYRNHWNVIFPDGQTAWLGEWAGNFSFFQEVNVSDTERFRNATSGKRIELMQVNYDLEMLDEHRLTFAEGEINDNHLKEKGFITLYLTHTSGAMALVNILVNKKDTASPGVYTNGIEAFAGNYVELQNLNLQNTRNYDTWR